MPWTHIEFWPCVLFALFSTADRGFVADAGVIEPAVHIEPAAYSEEHRFLIAQFSGRIVETVEGRRGSKTSPPTPHALRIRDTLTTFHVASISLALTDRAPLRDSGGSGLAAKLADELLV